MASVEGLPEQSLFFTKRTWQHGSFEGSKLRRDITRLNVYRSCLSGHHDDCKSIWQERDMYPTRSNSVTSEVRYMNTVINHYTQLPKKKRVNEKEYCKMVLRKNPYRRIAGAHVPGV